MTENKRFVKYDGNTIVDLKLVKSWIISNGDVDLLIELLNVDKTSENSKIVKELEKSSEKMIEKNKRWIVDDAGTLIDIVTRDCFDIVEEIVDTLNYYEETCLKYEKTIRELKDGTYKEPLPITQRK